MNDEAAKWTVFGFARVFFSQHVDLKDTLPYPPKHTPNHIANAVIRLSMGLGKKLSA